MRICVNSGCHGTKRAQNIQYLSAAQISESDLLEAGSSISRGSHKYVCLLAVRELSRELTDEM